MFTIEKIRVHGIPWFVVLKDGEEVGRAAGESGANNLIITLTRRSIHGSITKAPSNVIDYSTFNS